MLLEPRATAAAAITISGLINRQKTMAPIGRGSGIEPIDGIRIDFRLAGMTSHLSPRMAWPSEPQLLPSLHDYEVRRKRGLQSAVAAARI